MKILITADPEIPVPPTHYGGIERIIDFLIQGLVNQGHEVTLLAHEASQVPCRLVPYPGKSSLKKGDILRNTLAFSKTFFSSSYDLVHSFGRLAYLTPVLPLSLPKIMSYQRQPTLKGIRLAYSLAQKGTLVFTGCSEYIATQIRPIAPAFTIHNGVSMEKYQFQEHVAPDAPLVFLGRIERIKGTHLAIEMARQTGRNLIIAGNVPTDAISQQYFKEEILPHLNNVQIQYTGPVNDEQKNQLLGQAAAFLMPILWNEPFGIVMAEALACGTPVIAFSRGAVPEVVENGVNGFVAYTLEGLIETIPEISKISRTDCRNIAETKFSDTMIVKQYSDLYEKMINRSLN